MHVLLIVPKFLMNTGIGMKRLVLLFGQKS